MMLYIKQTKKMGRGVFAGREFRKGDILEKVELILMPATEDKYIKETILNRYIYFIDSDWTCIALGYGSLYNHSAKKNNADWKYNKDDKTFTYFATKKIEINEEIFINYGYDPKELL